MLVGLAEVVLLPEGNKIGNVVVGSNSGVGDVFKFLLGGELYEKVVFEIWLISEPVFVNGRREDVVGGDHEKLGLRMVLLGKGDDIFKV